MIDQDIVGSIAAFFTTIAFVPQAAKVIKTRETEAISFWMYLIFTIGVLLWLWYGFLINSLPVIIANIITAILAVIILYVKIREK